MSGYPEGWYVFAEARRVRRRPVKLRRFGRELVAWRDERGSIACLPAACPHRGADLARGRVRSGCIECPYHGFRFDGAGRCVATPCEGDRSVPPGMGAAALPVREDAGLLWLWHGTSAPVATLPWLPDLDPGDALVTKAGAYGCHFTRFVENTMDVHHFAFAHRTILPIIGSRVQMTDATLDGDLIRAAGTIEPGPGERFRRPASFSFEAVFPGLVRVSTAGIDLVASACPIDDDATWVTARYYRPRIGPRPLARAVAWLVARADWYTAGIQDRRLLGAVRPTVGSPRVNIAVGADRAISLWYRRLAQTHPPEPETSQRRGDGLDLARQPRMSVNEGSAAQP